METKNKILIVEDDKAMAKALKLKLEKSGFGAQIVSDGMEALKVMGPDKFKVILLDLVMPNMDGFGLLQEMKKRNIDTPVIVSTNLSQSEDEKRVKAFGVQDYFVKSNTPIANVINRVKELAV